MEPGGMGFTSGVKDRSSLSGFRAEMRTHHDTTQSRLRSLATMANAHTDCLSQTNTKLDNWQGVLVGL